METKDIIVASLNESWGYLTRALDGLIQKEITWAPAPHSNSIGFLVWHVTQAEDFWVNEVIGGGSIVHETGGWRERLGTAADSGGAGYTEEQLRSWPTPKLADLLGYARAVREKTLAVVDTITAEKLPEVPRPKYPKDTVGSILAHLVTEIALHVGQIEYLRGVQRGLKQVNWG